jgi:hypothetical protein
VVACLLLFPLFGLGLDQLMRHAFGLYIFVPCGFLAAWAVHRTQSWKWSTAERRVAFMTTD